MKYGGIGLHEARVVQIDPHMMVNWGKFIIIIPLFYFSTVVPPKLAILHLYLSIFTEKRLRNICYATGVVIVCNWVAVIIAGLLSCRPLSYFWTGQGVCINIDAWLRWGGFANILTDVVMLILPMPVVWRLHASTRLKLGIFVTFLLGSLYVLSLPSRPCKKTNLTFQGSGLFHHPVLGVLRDRRRGRPHVGGGHARHLGCH